MKGAYIETFGCQMNDHDSQRMSSVLQGIGYSMVDSVEQAKVVVLNTCSVRQNPENKVYSLLGRIRAKKNKQPDLIVGVGGCVAQQEGKKILQRERCVDFVFGPDYIFNLPNMIDRVNKGERVCETKWEKTPKDKTVNFVPEDQIECGVVDGCKAYVSITKGCDNFCTFCIVPMTRGREVSRSSEHILREVESLVSKGAKEIMLLGQNVNSYKSNECDFYELLKKVSEVEGLHRIRFTSPHPNDWNDQLSELLTQNPVICNQLHLPFQAGSNQVLQNMNRHHTREQYLKKVKYLQKINPEVGLSTDIIVGFPGETEEDFEYTYQVVQEVRFNQIYAFKYSQRPGTRAARMEDTVPREEKERRLARLLELHDQILEEGLRECVGKTYKVLLESFHPKQRGTVNGRTDNYRPVSIENCSHEIGDIVTVRIEASKRHSLVGRIIE